MGMKKRIMGLVMVSIGIGMLLVLIIPSWGYLLAVAIAACGLWNLVC